mmetsp:Transcript_36128/g.78583  ORF Transcript_36128/g.78583 Transcript_36128/m.78583 type:complete len:201 (+) Transcript_36128:445-1047(+)
MDPLSGRASGCRYGRPLPIGGEALLVVSRQTAMADDPTVGEDELSERRYVKAVCSQLGLVLLVHVPILVVIVIVFIHVLVVGNILPFSIVVFHVLLVHDLISIFPCVCVCLLVFYSLLLPTTTTTTSTAATPNEELIIGLSKVIKHVKLLLINIGLVSNLGMPRIDHMLLTTRPSLEDPLTVEAVVTELDLLVAVPQQSL